MKLHAESLTLARGARTIVSALSFTVAAGEALLLTGPNGAGKTTLLRAIAGFMPPAEGAIRLEGGEGEKSLAEQCHYVGHANGSKGNLTVEENLRFWSAYLGGAEDIAAVDDALERMNLLALADIPAAYLSAGQKRRLGLARLLVAKRAVWLLDEPTVSLDAASVALLATLVDAHVTAGGIAIAATHLPLGLARTRELSLARKAAA